MKWITGSDLEKFSSQNVKYWLGFGFLDCCWTKEAYTCYFQLWEIVMRIFASFFILPQKLKKLLPLIKNRKTCELQPCSYLWCSSRSSLSWVHAKFNVVYSCAASCGDLLTVTCNVLKRESSWKKNRDPAWELSVQIFSYKPSTFTFILLVWWLLHLHVTKHNR